MILSQLPSSAKPMSLIRKVTFASKKNKRKANLWWWARWFRQKWYAVRQLSCNPGYFCWLWWFIWRIADSWYALVLQILYGLMGTPWLPQLFYFLIIQFCRCVKNKMGNWIWRACWGSIWWKSPRSSSICGELQCYFEVWQLFIMDMLIHALHLPLISEYCLAGQ